MRQRILSAIMNRRDYLTGLVPLTAVSAGCTFLDQSEPRDLWTVSLNSVDNDEIDLTVEFRRLTATTENLATVWVEFSNTLDEPIRFVYLRGPYDSDVSPGVVLWSADEETERQSEECWIPDGIILSNGGLPTTTLSGGEAWTKLFGVWVEDGGTCPPDGLFTFSGSGESNYYEEQSGREIDWEFSISTEPVERISTA
jgi:hypothetical protein